MADPVSIGLGAASLIGGGIGGIVGSLNQQAMFERQLKLQEEAAKMYGGVVPPEVQQMIAEQVQSEFSGMKEDPRDLARQQAVFDQLQREIQQGGSDEARAADMRAANQASQFAAGQQATLADRLGARGLVTGGMSALLQQGAAQQAGQIMSDMETQQAAEAQRRRMAAIEAAAQMSGNMRQAGTTFATNRASAIDAMNRANAGMRWSAQQANAAQRQQAFGNQMQLTGAKVGAKLGQVGTMGQMGQAAADSGRDWATFLGGAGGKLLDYGLQDNSYSNKQKLLDAIEANSRKGDY